MADIVRVDEHDLPWTDYPPTGVANGRANVRVKPLTPRDTAAPGMQYVEYDAGWYGNARLWTMLRHGGEVWTNLPRAADGFGQKTFWWSTHRAGPPAWCQQM